MSGLVNGLMLCDEGKLGNVFEFQSEQDRVSLRFSWITWMWGDWMVLCVRKTSRLQSVA